jgi:hypothetical protein
VSWHKFSGRLNGERKLTMAAQHLDFEFHSERAKAELDLASRAATAAAASAHLRLSQLHVEKLRGLGTAAPALSLVNAQ